MKAQENYSKVIEALKKNQPSLNDAEVVRENILRRIQATPPSTSLWEKLDRYLFGWVHTPVLRLSMATLTLFFIGFFMVQQVTIQQRMRQLEKQLVSAGSTFNSQEPGLGMMQEVMLNVATKNWTKQDSITVATEDMHALLDQYRQLLERNENLKRRLNPESIPEKSNREMKENNAKKKVIQL